MLRESAAEKVLCKWLKKKGFVPYKGVDVDREAWKGNRPVWLLEVKGDQANEQALRQAFLTGLGQVFVARSHAPRLKVSIVVTPSYLDLIWKYADILKREAVSVYTVVGDTVKKEPLSALRPSFRSTKQGHPDGYFACGRARYRVASGKIVSYSLDSVVSDSNPKFAQVCKDLGISVGTDSGARVLSRRSTVLRRNI